MSVLKITFASSSSSSADKNVVFSYIMPRSYMIFASIGHLAVTLSTRVEKKIGKNRTRRLLYVLIINKIISFTPSKTIFLIVDIIL